MLEARWLSAFGIISESSSAKVRSKGIEERKEVTVQPCYGISIALPNDLSLAIARLERMLLSHVIRRIARKHGMSWLPATAS